MSTLANFKTFFEALTTRRTSEMMLDENLRQLEVTIMKEYSGPVTRVPDHIETRSTASWAATPANNDWTTSAATMEKQTRFEIDDESAEPVELRLLRRFKRKLRERRQRHPPMEYFADGCSVPKDHPDVDEIIVYLQPDTECQLALELPHTTATNSSASASSESLALSGSDGKDLGLPGYGSMPALHFDDNNPPAAEISFLDLPIDHAALGYAPTTSNPVCGYNPQAIAFPPQTTNVAIAEHYGHPLHAFHDASRPVKFNPFADDGPIVGQAQSEGHSYPENANTGRPVFTNPFDSSSNILSNAIFRMVPDEHIHSSPQQQYTAIPTEHAYAQADAVAHQYYASNQTMYSQYNTVSRTNTDDSSSRSSSRTFVDDMTEGHGEYLHGRGARFQRTDSSFGYKAKILGYRDRSVYTSTLVREFCAPEIEKGEIGNQVVGGKRTRWKFPPIISDSVKFDFRCKTFQNGHW
ncbi:hypothetical protein ARMSODRAFT_980659 [Armillaria solidipes]|uniref:Uncharacterized protein n=1 Tax=Armillaria solidipes TaxID=1076256 RepID=A0A2H3BH41_9AGAR|nr:hypothetical protein ARMSODRAFT_980659 [Armillaria solidipes]